jgi:CRISPR/Cas system-associated exonuclease Cas4 (RecB family)
MLRRHYEREGREDTGCRVARVEHPFYLPLNGEHTLAGRIDRVNVLEDGSIEVLDYKTGRSLPAQNEIDNDRQLAIYRLAAEKLLFPGKNITSTLYYLYHDQSFTAHPEPDLAERVEAEIHWTIEKIAAGEFPPRVTGFCERCDYRNYCGMFRPITVEETAQANIESLITELAQITQTLKESNAENKRQQALKGKLEKEILDWLKEAGAGFYQAGEMQVFSDVLRRISFPAEEVRKLLEPLGGWDKIGSKLTISKTALEELFKSIKLPPTLQYQIMGLGVATEKPTLKLKRVGKEEQEEDEV